MSLSDEDKLRLHVLITQDVTAIRINESAMVLQALTRSGEADVPLHPQGPIETYLKTVREFLSEHYLGIPGGYPLHLSTWTRMGDTNNTLDKMLLLGEPEAIVAAACSTTVSIDIARGIWWCLQTPEIARNLLTQESVLKDPLGVELANFLYEFLPFEENSLHLIQTIRYCLVGNLLSEKQKSHLWTRAVRKHTYFVGFLRAGISHIPPTESDHPDLAETQRIFKKLNTRNNQYACLLIRFLNADGRSWLHVLDQTLIKPREPIVVIEIFKAINQQIDAGLYKRGAMTLDDAELNAENWCTGNTDDINFNQLVEKLPARIIARLKALLVLAQCGEDTLIPIFSGRTATGSVMRQHLQPLTSKIRQCIKTITD